MLDLMGIYTEQLIKESKEYRAKNPKTDSRYRASSSGMCNRKIFFEAIEKATPTTEIDKRSQRITRNDNESVQRRRIIFFFFLFFFLFLIYIYS
jgi:hypothetical protein